QGVLLLNTVLTVEAHQPMSHQNRGWETFTLEVVKKINEKDQPVVFILWGSHAQKFIPYINNRKHYILKSVHPSPLSAHRGFFGSKPFSKTNDFLIKNNIKPIDWTLT
ncbi:MAG: uracil-DNA glycosylase, partial [Acholeplasmataceae bacterium]|nr:uracil-DNA glycosylase [Acholeplasmataceae bacterium]